MKLWREIGSLAACSSSPLLLLVRVRAFARVGISVSGGAAPPAPFIFCAIIFASLCLRYNIYRYPGDGSRPASEDFPLNKGALRHRERCVRPAEQFSVLSERRIFMELCMIPKVVGKGPKGRTACGSSAYRSCDRLVDNAGNVHDFRKKGGYVMGGVELPAGAPEELRNRQTLWSRHEKRDIRKDAELFRDIMITMPNELSYLAVARVARSLAGLLTEKGMCVQWDIHDTTKDKQRNLHVHLMVTMREILPDGTFGNKNRSWNRYNGGLNVAELLRPEAARLMNAELEAIGSSDRVEHESYADRGIDKIPTKHMGVAATAMERKDKKTNKGNQNRYIDWLNKIHAENLRQAEAQAQGRYKKLDDLISRARAQQDGNEAFKDWDALFAMLRDTRRCRAAMNSELGKIGKVISAYVNGDEGYVHWAGCDPRSKDQRLALETMQNDLRVNIKMLDKTEAFLLDSKELYKAHNKVVYSARKVAWDEYQIEKSKRSMNDCARRIESLTGYMNHLRRSISLVDVILKTQEYQDYRSTMAELDRKLEQVKEGYERHRAELKMAKTDLKEHKKEAADAARAQKKLEDEAR